MEKALIFNFHAINVGNFEIVDLFMLFNITYRLFNYTQQHMYTHAHTHTQTHIYILFMKSKIYIKIFKTLLHVSITRSASGSIYCSLLKL